MTGKIKRKIYNLVKKEKSQLEQLIEKGLIVGKNFNMLHGVIIDYSHSWLIEIGDDVTLAPNVHILAHDASTKMYLGYTRLGKVKIGNRVFIGAGSIVLPGVEIGDNVIIGAGSVVTGDIPSGTIAVGNPAKVVGDIEDYLSRKRKEMESVPVFDSSYTIAGGIDTKMKSEMKEKMTKRFAYVV